METFQRAAGSGKRLKYIIVLASLVIFLVDIRVAFPMDQTLLIRPRHKWEWDDSKNPADHDHLGRGWDAIYLGDRAKSEQDKKFQYKVAEEEFRYLINYMIQYSKENRYNLINHNFIGSALGMSEVGFRTKRPDLAKPIYEIGIRESEASPILFVHYALYVKRLGSLPEAISVLEKATSLWPKEPGLHHYLGLLYFENKNYGKAREEEEIIDQLGGINSDELKKKLNSLPKGTVEKKE